MRVAALVVIIACSAAAERPFDYPVSTRDGRLNAIFTKTTFHDTKSEGTMLAIKDREHNTLFEHELSRDVACNAEWTHDSNFLVITALNGAGHQPWHYHVYVFSLKARELRALEEPEKTPFVSADMFFQPPHTVILIGNTFEHGLEAPEDPVLLRFELGQLWDKLPKV
ncbi:MAG: hypothetical protein JO354_00795 [Verrucomicrobia bacterium]|nr:hypothetical protein [Verrucomicrobiota bacterium]